MTNLEAYYEAIQRGEILAGQELSIMLGRLMDDLTAYRYDTAEADERIDFMEHCVRLTKSPFYGQPMKLMLWQKAFIEALYSFKMPDGTDRFRRALLLIGRKNTKSELCSALGLTEMVVGNAGSDIVCSSNDDTQANILYDAINTMRLMVDPQQADTWKNQQCIRNKINNSKVFKLSDRTRNKEGRNIDFAIIDECHEMKDATIVKSIEQSQSLKPNPKLILITTEGFVTDGFLDDELRRARAIINGESDEERYLPWLYTQDSEREIWEDPRTWVKSNPSLGIVKRWDYMEEQVDLARRSKADRMYTLSKDFNVKVNEAAAWLLAEEIRNEDTFDLEDFRGCIALAGVDLAETTDMAAAHVLLMKQGDKTKYIHSMYWVPESKLEAADDKEAGAKYTEWAKAGLVRISEGNEVDVGLIADWLYELYKEYGLRVYMTGYDQRFAKDFLKRMDYYGFDAEMVYQNRYVMSPPMRLVEADLKDKLINYNNNEVTRWCLGNTAVKIWDTGLIMPVKIKGQPARRKDGTDALIDAYEIYRRYRTEFMGALK